MRDFLLEGKLTMRVQLSQHDADSAQRHRPEREGSRSERERCFPDPWVRTSNLP